MNYYRRKIIDKTIQATDSVIECELLWCKGVIPVGTNTFFRCKFTPAKGDWEGACLDTYTMRSLGFEMEDDVEFARVYGMRRCLRCRKMKPSNTYKNSSGQVCNDCGNIKKIVTIGYSDYRGTNNEE